MAIEIERKFLVTGDAWREAGGELLVQGYLSRDKDCTVRVRIAGEQAFLTIKGKTEGASRQEFEYPVPLADAESLMALCQGPVIRKTRRRIPLGKHVWEVDEFFGDNAGLVVAEIELKSADEDFARPDWLGQEVTHDARYYNSALSELPYTRWPERD